MTCSPDPTTAGTLNCTVQLATAAPTGGANVTLQAASSQVQMPTQVQVPAGAQSAQFKATVQTSDQDQQVKITAALNGNTNSLAIQVTGIRPLSLVCPSSIQAGVSASCVVRMTSTNVPAVARLTVASTSPNLKMPVSMTTRLRQTRLTFMVASDPLAPQQTSTISVQFGSTTVSTPVAIQPLTAPILTVPPDQAVVPGNALNFSVSAVDPAGLPVTLSAASLPDGSSFNASGGSFSWTPTTAQQGTFSVSFTATNSASAFSTGQVTIHVDSGIPLITDIRNAASQSQPACSPGSVASIIGRWLTSAVQPVTDLTGQSMSLGGAQVLVNGAATPVVAVSWGRMDFLCPSAPPGTVLSISVQNGAGSSVPAQTTMQEVSLGAYTNDGSGQGQGTIFLVGTSLLATSRTYQSLGQPAQIGDAITVRVTGMGDASGLPMVKIGDLYARADSVNPVSGMAGVYDIAVTVPPGVTDGQAIPISVVSPLPQSSATCNPGILSPGTWPSAPSGQCATGARTGDATSSNMVTAAIELGY